MSNVSFEKCYWHENVPVHCTKVIEVVLAFYIRMTANKKPKKEKGEQKELIEY